MLPSEEWLIGERKGARNLCPNLFLFCGGGGREGLKDTLVGIFQANGHLIHFKGQPHSAALRLPISQEPTSSLCG